MEAISHIAIYYLISRALKLEKKWAGMPAAVLPDVAIALVIWFLPGIGFDINFVVAYNLNLFLHSIFPLFMMLPILLISRKYFYPVVLGYGSHLLLDYMTHTTIRMPFYPVSTWKAPMFLISYLNPLFTLGVNIVILVLIVTMFHKGLKLFFGRISKDTRNPRLCIPVYASVIIAFVFSSWYSLAVLNFGHPYPFISIPLIGVNLLLLGAIFMMELDEDPNTSPHLRRLHAAFAGKRKIS